MLLQECTSNGVFPCHLRYLRSSFLRFKWCFSNPLRFHVISKFPTSSIHHIQLKLSFWCLTLAPNVHCESSDLNITRMSDHGVTCAYHSQTMLLIIFDRFVVCEHVIQIPLFWKGWDPYLQYQETFVPR